MRPRRPNLSIFLSWPQKCYKRLRVGRAAKGLDACAFTHQAVGLNIFIPRGVGLVESGGPVGSLSRDVHIKSPSFTTLHHM